MFFDSGGGEGGVRGGGGFRESGGSHGARLAYEKEETEEKEDPSDVLRERMHGLLEDVKETWERERRDPNKIGAGSLLREEYEQLGYYGEEEMGMRGGGSEGGRKESKRPFHRTENRRLNHTCTKGCAICGFRREQEMNSAGRRREDEQRNKLNFLDSGAGPREFWATVSPSITYHESQGAAVQMEEVEQHLWRLVLLVRCQDRGRGLRLQRHESQRKLLDLRFFELILLSVRIGFMKEKLVEIEPVRGGIGKGFLKLKFRDVGKWTGRGEKEEGEGEDEAEVALSGRDGWRQGAIFSGGGATMSGTKDGKNFARITREFERMKKERLGDPRDTVSGFGGAGLRSKVGSRGGLSGSMGRGGMNNPMGHSTVLGGTGGGGGRKKGGGGGGYSGSGSGSGAFARSSRLQGGGGGGRMMD